MLNNRITQFPSYKQSMITDLNYIPAEDDLVMPTKPPPPPPQTYLGLKLILLFQKKESLIPIKWCLPGIVQRLFHGRGEKDKLEDVLLDHTLPVLVKGLANPPYHVS